jgi:hypothetical protein
VKNQDPGEDGRVYISRVKVGNVTFHAHSTVDADQVYPLSPNAPLHMKLEYHV